MTVYKIAWCSVICVSLVLAETPRATFTIGGTVVDAVTGKPVKRVRIVLTADDPRGPEFGSSVTAEDGKFLFEVAPGKYSLRAERNGLAPQSYGAVSLDHGLGIAIVAGPGQITDKLLFRLYSPGAISGTIGDETGEPVEGALVQLVRQLVVGGRKIITPRGWFYTNDLGEYRFGGLGAGTYYLAVTGKPWFAEELPLAHSDVPPNRPSVAFAPVFYPNARDAGAAAPLLLKPGQEVTANFTLATTPGFDISIRFNAHGINARSRLRITIAADGILGAKLYERVTTSFGGSVHIPSVPPGRYTLTVLTDRDTLLASETVDVGSSNLDLQIDLKEPPSIHGFVQIEGADASALARLVISLRNDAANFGIARTVARDASVTFPSVPPGKYRVTVFGQKTVFTTRVSVDNGPLGEPVLDVGPGGVSTLKILAVAGSGRLRGFVYRRGQPLSGVLVVLVPAALIAGRVDSQGFMTDSDGSFDWEAIHPGEYKLFATEDTELEHSSIDALKPMLPVSKSVRVSLNQTTEEKLELK